MGVGRHIIYILLLLFGVLPVAAQNKADSVVYKNGDYSKKKSSKLDVSRAASSLSKSLASGADELETASKYEQLARELTEKGEYAKAEENLKKALEIYTRLNRNDQAAAVTRLLAKSQESQSKITPAIANYLSAGNLTADKTQVQVNQNDANRLLNTHNPQAQIEYTQSNIRLFEINGNRPEAVEAYKKLGASQLLQNNTIGAASSFKKAIEQSKNGSEIADISQTMANAVKSSDQIDTAIKVAETILQKARTEHDTDLQINQLLQLAQLQARHHQLAKAQTLQEAAYNLALSSGNTLMARNCLVTLAGYYKAQHNGAAAVARYEQFLSHLDTLIRSDSSLVDAGLFGITENRIKDLEKEKRLQQELISKKNTLNYFLTGSVILMLLLFIFIIRALNAIRVKNKKIALQSLRREMNPHFIFNSLNSVNQYIAENNELAANKYLTSYSGLMRNMMEHSHKDFVPLTAEVEQLKEYLHLEHMRFSNQFVWQLSVEETLDTDAVLIPNMLLQPHLENAVWHGLRYKPEKGLLKIHFAREARELRVTIEDDGIGLTESQRLKTVNQKVHQSRGLNNTRERISLLNDLYPVNIRLLMEEITGAEQTGTRVILQLVLLDKI